MRDLISYILLFMAIASFFLLLDLKERVSTLEVVLLYDYEIDKWPDICATWSLINN